MRILLYSHNFLREGAPIILLRLVRDLAKRHQIDFMRLINRAVEPLQEEFVAAGARMIESAQLVEYDVALYNTITAHNYVAKSQGRVPCLWWVHEPRFGLRYLDNDFDYSAFEKATRIVFPTRWQADALYKPYLKRNNWTVVPYGIGLDTAPRPCPFDKQPDKFYLLHLGRIDHRKGQDLSVSALKLLNDPRLVLVFVGNRKPDDPYAAQLDAAGVPILYTGSVPEETVAAYIQHCDAMVFPTRDDLITLAILEGLCLSKCVLASDFGPIPETILHGRTGLLSPVGDARVLAANIRAVMADPILRERLGRLGRRILERKHSFEAHVAGMERELTRIARKPRPNG